MRNEEEYLNILKNQIYEKISQTINYDLIDNIVQDHIIKNNIVNKRAFNFQVYYFDTLNNEINFFKSNDFFRQFKKQYALQGIDNAFLDKLEIIKSEILKLIRDNNIVKLYFDFFKKAQVKYGDKEIEKDLGSFFAKLVHTFCPNDYCALDNPIKIHFGLSKESFFIAFIIISDTYKLWAYDNKELIKCIRDKILTFDIGNILKSDNLTDLKILDLIFWSIANQKK